MSHSLPLLLSAPLTLPGYPLTGQSVHCFATVHHHLLVSRPRPPPPPPAGWATVSPSSALRKCTTAALLPLLSSNPPLLPSSTGWATVGPSSALRKCATAALKYLESLMNTDQSHTIKIADLTGRLQEEQKAHKVGHACVPRSSADTQLFSQQLKGC